MLQVRTRRSRRLPLLAPALALALPLLAGCEGDDDDDGALFVIRTTTHSLAPGTDAVVGGPWIVYFADEATTGTPGVGGSTDLNGDADAVDTVAVVTHVGNLTSTVLRAAVAAAVVGNEVYLLVQESDDGTDWNGDTDTTDLVLLHWSSAAGATTFVDEADVDAQGLVAVENERLFYASDDAPAGPDDTTLRRLEVGDPLTPVPVANVVGGGQLAVGVLGAQEGLVLLAIDETEAPGGAADANGDGDALDEHVLALLDGTDDTGQVVSTGLALGAADAPVDARRDAAADDWLVAFLVDETAQGANLNDETLPEFSQPLTPNACQLTPDTDTLDQVLHYVLHSELVAGTGGPVNTGLAGVDRAVALDGFVATISPEADAECDLNGDGDTTDRIARWTETAVPITPPRDETRMRALFDAGGGSDGLARLDDRLVAIVDEAADSEDIDGGGATGLVVGFLDPDDGFTADWTFDHVDANPGTGISGVDFVGSDWMAPEGVDGRLPMTFLEENPALNLNVDLFCTLQTKDADTTDALPLWTDFEGPAASPILDFDGQGYAVPSPTSPTVGSPGTVLTSGFAFYRVSEALDSFDYNTDGDTADFVLFRNPLVSCATVAMATATNPGVPQPVIWTDGGIAAAFASSEFAADATDLNGDGDVNDVVLRFFRIP